MNSRGLIASPEAQDKASFRLSLAHWKAPVLRSPPMSAFGSKADVAKRPDQVGFAPNSGHEMAIRDLWNLSVRFGAKNVRAGEKRWRHREAKHLGGLEVDNMVILGRRLYR
jgi:hypothetical protein